MARQPATTRAEIIRAAAKLFEERGYRNTTIEAIAAEVGIAKPTVYAYIDSKNEILASVFETCLGQLTSGVADVRSRELSHEQQLRETVRITVEMAVELRPFLSLTLNNERDLEADVAKRFRKMAKMADREIEMLVRDGQTAGSFASEADPAVVALLLTGMIGSLTRWYRPNDVPGQLPVDGVVDQIMTMLSGFVLKSGKDRPFKSVG